MQLLLSKRQLQMSVCSGGVSFKMIFKVLVSVALLLVSIEARALPLGNGKSLEELIREFKDIEKVRHGALQVILNKPEYKEDENMVKYMATLTEFDNVLVEMRKAIKDLPSLLHPDGESSHVGNTDEILADFKRLRLESEVLKKKLTDLGRAVPSRVFVDNEFQKLMTSFNVSGKKLMEIGLRIITDIFTTQNSAADN